MEVMTNQPVAIITGASSGIGEKTALTLADNGYRVVLAARRLNRLEEIAGQIRNQGGEVLSVQLDLSQLDQIQKLVDQTRKAFGQIDILINNAGSARHLWLDEQSLEQDIQQQLQINLIGMIQLTRLVLPFMVAAGSGQIIHLSSVASWVGVPTYSIYNASKFGARGFMASIRRELRGTGVTISEIFPGAVDTEFGQDPEVSWKTTTVTPKFALLSPQSVADTILRVIRMRKSRAVIPGFMWLAIWADTHIPGFVSWVLAKYFYTLNGIRYTWRQRKE
jgi:short-subunit dehydrogenase